MATDNELLTDINATLKKMWKAQKSQLGSEDKIKANNESE